MKNERDREGNEKHMRTKDRKKENHNVKRTIYSGEQLSSSALG